jgi:DNA-binding NarL/FixJ family response regulator
MRYTVCLVEDDWYACRTLSACVSKCKEFELVKAYSNGKEALQDLPTVKPDIVLMDIRLPGVSGIICLRKLRALSPPFESRVLILTEYQNDDLIFEALRAGADGYLSKEHASHQRELETAMLEAVRGGGPMSPGIARRVIMHFHCPVSTASEIAGQSPPQRELTAREKEILGLRGQGFRYKEIAEKLHISEDGVGKHVHAIRQKLHPRLRSEAVSRSVDRSGTG